jgi:hypothetical protein
MSNYGVLDKAGNDFPSKAAFRRAVAAGEVVRLYATSPFQGVLPPPSLTTLAPSDVVVGPNPYTKRDWYANVKTGRDGKPRVV